MRGTKSTRPGGLPLTGLPMSGLIMIGAALVAAGVTARVAVRRNGAHLG